jgi:organic radical activating enzyme
MLSSDYIDQKEVYKHDRFCSLPWEEVDINLRDRSITWCCYAKRYPFPKVLELDFFLKNAEEQERKDYFLQNKLHPACEVCWKSEEKSNSSLRKTKSNTAKHNTIKNNPDKNYLRVVGLTFDNICTQSCLYCGPNFSSIIAEERGLENKFLKYNNEDMKIVLEWLNHVTKDRTEYLDLRILGGEPLASLEFYKFLDLLQKDMSDRKFNIHIVTNCSATDKLLDKIESIIKASKTKWRWSFGLSNEAIGEVAENIRFHLDWSVFDKNFNFFIRQPASFIVLAATPNIFSIKNLPLYIKYVYDNITKVDVPFGFTNNWVIRPNVLSPANLPVEFKQYVQEAKEIVLNAKGKHADACKNNVINWLDKLENIIGTGEYSIKDIEQFLEQENKYKKHKLNTKLLLNQVIL